ncbi:P-selectin [Tiliqua scincoides]|uniref:P-selectin n=1 Tax=Tiliqua scincoides TaxID=71010 RepID=UPI003462355B
MSVSSGRSLYRWTDDHMLFFVIICWGLFPQGGTWTYHYGTTSALSWPDARRFCQQYYTDLVAIQNQDEIYHLNRSLPFYHSYYWIGIRKINNTWTWVGTNKRLTKEAENWAKGEPNNKRTGEDCVEIYIQRKVDSGKWNDERCNKRKRALCYKASCQPFSCSQHGECVETIGNYTCQCYPGFFGPECENVVKCSDFDTVHRPLHMNCSHPFGTFSYSSSCSFSCNEGFKISYPATLQCLSSGIWTAEMPQCVAVQCHPQGALAHGNFTCSHLHGEFQYQSSCTFHCTEGFRLVGEEVTQCSASGEWTAPQPACQAVECPALGIPDNGGLNCSHPHGDFAYSSNCTFSCKTGFVRVGKEQLQCTAQGMWSEKTPICEAMRCHRLQSLNQGRTACSHPIGEFAYRSTCEFACEPGFALVGTNASSCLASGNWSAPLPTCQAVECPALAIPDNGGLNCSHPHGDFAYSSNCTFSCKTGFVRVGKEQLQCTAQGMWSEKTPICEAMRCHRLQSLNQGRMTCSHPIGEFAYRSTCEFACEPGFALVGTNASSCLASGNWSAPLPTCQAVECPALAIPDNGGLNCSHPHGDFAYSSNCTFSCKTGFVRVGKEQLQCTAQGMWSEKTPICEAMRCHRLQSLNQGRMTCSHPTGEFAYRSTCEFACEPGFALVGTNASSCLASGNWSAPLPTCQAVECPALAIPDNGGLNCSHPHGDFAYSSSCTFSCKTGFVRVGKEQLQCTAQGMWSEKTPVCEAMRCHRLQSLNQGRTACSHPIGEFAYRSTCDFACEPGFALVGTNATSCLASGNWSAPLPTCQAIECPVLDASENGRLNCSHPHGDFAYSSSCMLTCNTGFVRVGEEQIHCTALGMWSEKTPICEAINCPQLRSVEHLDMNCSHPWGPFSYGSICNFHCAEGYILNGTSRMQCQPGGHWSTEMPGCQENVARPLAQALLYIGGITASVVALVLSGVLIALAIKRLTRREEKKRLLNPSSDLGVPGVFSNAAFDSISQ